MHVSVSALVLVNAVLGMLKVRIYMGKIWKRCSPKVSSATMQVILEGDDE